MSLPITTGARSQMSQCPHGHFCFFNQRCQPRGDPRRARLNALTGIFVFSIRSNIYKCSINHNVSMPSRAFLFFQLPRFYGCRRASPCVSMPSRAFLFFQSKNIAISSALLYGGLNALTGIFVFSISLRIMLSRFGTGVSMPSRAFLFFQFGQMWRYWRHSCLNALTGIFVFSIGVLQG